MEYVKMKKLLDDNKLEHDEMDTMWQTLKIINPIVRSLDRVGKNWTDLPPHLIPDLRRQYEKLAAQGGQE